MKPLLSYAYLYSSFNAGQRHPLDALDNVVLRSLLEHQSETAGLQEIQKWVRDDWGLSVPLNVLRYTMGRLRARNIIERKDVDNSGIDSYLVLQNRELRATTREKEGFARERYNRFVGKIRATLIREGLGNTFDADEIIEKWLDESAISFLGGARLARSADSEDRQVNRIISLVLRVTEEAVDDEALRDLSELALGDVLYRSLRDVTEHETLEVPNDIGEKPMANVYIYLDVRILMAGCGYYGERLSEAALELFEMARKSGCQLRAFRHTTQELSEGIAAVANNMLRGTAHGPILTWAYENTLSPADVLLEAADVEARVVKLGIEIENTPTHDIPLTMDELELDRIIEVDVRQDNPKARQRDVDSLTAIFRLRAGQPMEKLERCLALFVTHNKSLADGVLAPSRNVPFVQS